MNKNSFCTELAVAIQSSPIVYISHFDYELMDRELEMALNHIGLSKDCIAEYDLNLGIVDFDGKKQKCGTAYAAYRQLDTWLECIVEAKNTDTERVFLFKNLQSNQDDNPAESSMLGTCLVQTLLQTFAAKYKHRDYEDKGNVYAIVIVSPMPVMKLPSSIEKIFTVLDYAIPSVEDILEKVKTYPVGSSVTCDGKTVEEFQKELTCTLLGLHMYEVERILRSISIRAHGKLKPSSLEAALDEKQRIVKKSGIIEVVNPDTSFDEIGGLDQLKADLERKALLFGNLSELQNRNGKVRLPVPKGILIIGMPGCGKTMIAKAVAERFKVSLLRLDVNRLMGQYVGMSEENLRRALQTAETAHPCVLWIDEVEKAFAGAGANSGDNDMLVQRLMGQFLTWMQERKSAVYIVATANDVMRPEFMRKGRFDEVYFVDFPNLEERKSILKNKMMHYGFLSTKSDTLYDFSDFVSDGKENDAFNKLASMMLASQGKEISSDGFSEGFSGAEIESVVNQVMEGVYVKYLISVKDKAPLTTPIRVTVPDFEQVISDARPSVMANQVTTQEEKKRNPMQATNIERIREMQRIYKFKKATK